jgi:hypothetical protein
LRYKLERDLEEIYTYEECVWQKKGVVKNGSYGGMPIHDFFTVWQMVEGESVLYSPWKLNREKSLNKRN